VGPVPRVAKKAPSGDHLAAATGRKDWQRDTGSPEEQWREDCAPRRILELFATKWTSMVLHTLHARHGGQARSAASLRSLPGISKKMFAQTAGKWRQAG
jgi:DNA-binding HxlR family transcriptional regulator